MLGPIFVNLLANSRKPPLVKLRGIKDPEHFFWQILPHAARTFSLVIVFLPPRMRRALALAYLLWACTDFRPVYLVLGASGAGLKAAARARRLLPRAGITVVDERDYAAIGGDAESISARLAETWTDGLDRAGAISLGRSALAW